MDMVSPPDWVRSTPESEALFAEETLILCSTELVHEVMDIVGIDKAELERRTKVELSDTISVRDLARMIHAMGYKVSLEAKPISWGSERTTPEQTT